MNHLFGGKRKYEITQEFFEKIFAYFDTIDYSDIENETDQFYC